MYRFKSNQQRAKNVEYSFVSFIIVTVFLIISNLISYIYLSENNTLKSDPDLITNQDLIEFSLAIFYLTSTLFCYVTFIKWFRRAYYNQEQKFERMKFSNGWAAGSWFVPILNFFRPFQMMQEIYINAENYLINNGLDSKNSKRYKLLVFWWISWVVLSVLARVLELYFNQNNAFMNPTLTSVIIDVIMLIAFLLLALLAIQVIRNYTKMELKLIAHDPEGNTIFTTENSDLLDS
jgi:hypothetical protein